MKILIISNCPLVESQGSGYIIINTAKCLKYSGHVVDMIPPEKIEIFPKMAGKAKLYRMILGMGKWALQNKKALKKYNMVIYYGAESFLAVLIIKYFHRLKIPIVLHSNGLEVHNGYVYKKFEHFLGSSKKWYYIEMGWFFKLCYKYVDAIIVLSHFNRDFGISNLKIPDNKIFTLEPCLPDIFFEHKIIEKKGKNIISYCGTWIERKGIESIIGSMPNILRKNPAYRFRIIGVGPNFDKSVYFAADLLARIEVYPLIESKERLMELYAETDIFLFPSFCESFGLVVAEAMFCGCCVITGPTGIAANIKDGTEALVLETPETTAVANALEQLMASPVLRKEMSEAARLRFKGLKWSDYTKQLEEVISKIEGLVVK